MVAGWRGVAVTLCLMSSVSGDNWRWPEPTAAASAATPDTLRVDGKVRFADEESSRDIEATRSNDESAQRDAEIEPFAAPSDTQGFYNRPGEAGRYHVRVERPQPPPAMQYGLALTQIRPGSSHSAEELEALEPSRSLKNRRPIEYYNEVDTQYQPPERQVVQDPRQPQLFTPGEAPEGGPSVLTGPHGPTGLVGPHDIKQYDGGVVPPILTGPEPSGVIGPRFPNQNVASASAQRDVLVGPRGPTGIIGPGGYNGRPAVLVGPGGPTGNIGPQGVQGYNRDVLVGPGGPTGVVGPTRRPYQGGNSYGVAPYGYNNNNRQNQYSRGVLVGPGGPSGTIGPGRGLLVGPGGPTGAIGPRRNDYGI